MFEFHYKHILPTYGERAVLCFTDTDSMCYHIKADDIYKDMRENMHLFDTSNYPKDHFLYSEKNKKVLGLFKDDVGGKIIKQFAGLRPKLYSLLLEDGYNKKTAKGVKKATIN